jgi:hypothetical protein
MESLETGWRGWGRHDKGVVEEGFDRSPQCFFRYQYFGQFLAAFKARAY